MKVRMLETVISHIPLLPSIKAPKGQEYDAKIRPNGGVRVWLPYYQAWLGLKPGEFWIIELTDAEYDQLTRASNR